MQGLRQAANVVECALGDFAHLAQISSESRSFGNLLARTAKHRPHRGQKLSELVMQLARDFPQRGFPCRDELLCEIASFVRQRGELCEQATVGRDEIEA